MSMANGRWLRRMKADKRQQAEAVWLHYFNRTLLANGLIDEAEWSKMNWAIQKSMGNMER